MKKNRILIFIMICLMLFVCGTMVACNNNNNSNNEETPEEKITFNVYDKLGPNVDSKPISYTVSKGRNLLSEKPTVNHCVCLGVYDSEGMLIYDTDNLQWAVDVFSSEFQNKLQQNDSGRYTFDLYVKWEKEQVSFYLDVDGGVYSGIDSFYATYGEPFPQTSLPIPTPQVGNVFVGWYSGNTQVSDGSGKCLEIIVNDSNFEEDEQGFVLTAKYSRKEVTVYFNYNDDSTATESLRVMHGDTLDSNQYPELLDKGTTEIIGWSLNAYSLLPLGDKPLTNDITLYAIWKRYKDFSFYSEIEDEIPFRQIRVHEGDSPVKFDDATLPGRTLDGWYPTKNFAGNPVTSFNYNLNITTYYAKWNVADYKIEFILDEGEQPIQDIFYHYGDEVELPTAADKTGYTFIGWSEENSGEAITIIKTSDYGDKVLYPVFKPDKVKISLYYFDDFTNTTQVHDEQVDYGSTLSLWLPPERSAYSFTGWYDGESESANLIANAHGYSLKKWDTLEESALYAHWTIKKYTVVYQSNGGTTVKSQEYSAEERIVFPESPTKKDYVFAGWYCDQELKTLCINDSIITEDMVLYAKWTQGITISKPDDLRKIERDPSLNYYLVADIDMGGAYWTPIQRFSGTLGGNGYTISNFNIDNSESASFIVENSGLIQNIKFSDVSVINRYIGLSIKVAIVVATNRGTMENIGITDCETFYGASLLNQSEDVKMGVLCAENFGTIKNCNVAIDSEYEFTVKNGLTQQYNSSAYYGAIAENLEEGTIKNVSATTSFRSSVTFSESNAAYTFDQYYGGIVGRNKGIVNDSTASVSWETECSAINNKSKFSRYIGGAVGYNENLINGIVANGKMESTNVDYSEPTLYVGGLIGSNTGESVSVSECVSDVDIDCALRNIYYGTYGYVGGIAGYSRKEMVDVMARGSIVTEKIGMVGGLSGALASDGQIRSSAFLGEIEDRGDSSNVGMLVGCASSNSIVQQCICDGVLYSTVSPEYAVGNGSGQIDSIFRTTRAKMYFNGKESNGKQSGVTIVKELIELYDSEFLSKRTDFNRKKWGVSEGLSIYLLRFSDHKHVFAEDSHECEDRWCILPGCNYVLRNVVEHAFEDYVYNDDAQKYTDGTETAPCKYGCGLTNTRSKTGSALINNYVEIGDMNGLAGIVNDADRKYRLTNDIDMFDTEWIPIPQFDGILDGNGCTISNFKLTTNNNELAFIQVNNGTIKNLTFSNVSVTQTFQVNSYTAVVAAKNNGTIENVSIKSTTINSNLSTTTDSDNIAIGAITGLNYIFIGGITGLNENGIIESSSVDLMLKINFTGKNEIINGQQDFSATLVLGCIAGQNRKAIKNCLANSLLSGTITLSGKSGTYNNNFYLLSHFGGIVGYNTGEETAVEGCASTLDWRLQTNYINDYAAQKGNFGGIAGYNSGNVTLCQSKGKISLENTHENANNADYDSSIGGIIGRLSANGLVNICQSLMDIDVVVDSEHLAVGGLVGTINNENSILKNGFYKGTIKTDHVRCVGGLVGLYYGKVSQCVAEATFEPTSTIFVGCLAGHVTMSSILEKSLFVGEKGDYNFVANNSDLPIDVHEVTDDNKSAIYTDSFLFEGNLFSDDIWGIDEGNCIYLIAFYTEEEE